MKNIWKIISSTMKAYGYTKMSMKTGMQFPEILLLKDGIKTCEKYYTQQGTLLMKSIFSKNYDGVGRAH